MANLLLPRLQRGGSELTQILIIPRREIPKKINPKTSVQEPLPPSTLSENRDSTVYTFLKLTLRKSQRREENEPEDHNDLPLLTPRDFAAGDALSANVSGLHS